MLMHHAILCTCAGAELPVCPDGGCASEAQSSVTVYASMSCVQGIMQVVQYRLASKRAPTVCVVYLPRCVLGSDKCHYAI